MIIGVFYLLIFLTSGVQAFVFSCEEVKYKLINTNLQEPTRFVCLVVDEGYSSLSQLDKIYAQADKVSTSFSDILNATCIERPADGSWRIVADPPVALDCSQEFTLIFTSSPSVILRAPHGIGVDNVYVEPDVDHVFVSPPSGLVLMLWQCKSDGTMTIFSGAGTGDQEARYPMVSWRQVDARIRRQMHLFSCADIPKWLVFFDNVITVRLDADMLLVLDYRTNDNDYYEWLRMGDRVAIMGNGRSDNLENLHPERNFIKFQIENGQRDNASVAITGECSFDGGLDGHVVVKGTLDWITPWSEEFGNGSHSAVHNAQSVEVDFVTDALHAWDIGNSQDNFIIHLAIGDPAVQTSTAAPIIETDPFCGCALDKKFGMPDGWDSTEIWLDVVIILDTSQAMGDVALIDASSLIESFIGSDDGDVLNTDTMANFYTRVGLIAMSDKAEVIYNLNMTKTDKVADKVHINKGLQQIDVIAAFNAALSMFADGLKSQPDRATTRQVIYYMTDSDPVFDPRPLDGFKASQGIIIVNDFLEPGDVPRPGLKDLASDGYFFSDIQYNYMATIQLFCKANCYCRPDKNRTPYAGHTTDPAVRASGGCFRVVPAGVPYSKMKANCEEGFIVSIHDMEKATFVNKQFAAAAPNSDYFWIGYSKSDAGWQWEDESTNPYTNWDGENGEPSSNSVAKCAYVDTTTPNLFWGAGNCNVGFPSVCEYAPCAVGNKNC